VGNELWPDLQSVFPHKMEGLRETITPQLKQGLCFKPSVKTVDLWARVCASDLPYMQK